MKLKNFRPFPLIFFYALVVLTLYGCAAKPKDPVAIDQVKKDAEDFLRDTYSKDISSYTAVCKDISTDENDGVFDITATYTYGDITYTGQLIADYSYSRTGGWSLDSLKESSLSDKKAVADEFTCERFCEDLENTRYYSGYSDMIFENKRLIDAKIDSQELDAGVGYVRANLTVKLNADNVYEILSVYCEYLLDENNKFYLSTSDVNLSNVEVQGSVPDSMIKDSFLSVNFYRDNEESVWRIGELNKLNYEVTNETLDKENNSDVVELTFRGEGLYMYVSGKCTMTFHFSSGWYLYDSVVDSESLDLGMLTEAWDVGEEIIIDSIINDNTLTYNEVEDYTLTEDMIQNLNITERRISDNGRLQTVYFNYNLLIKNTEFDISGYGKYDLQDGFLSVSKWHESIDNVKFDITGKWSGYDVASEYIAYYELDIVDNQSGSLEGILRVYSVDYDIDPSVVNSAEIKIIGNLYNGTSFEIMDTEWISGDIKHGFIMPRGYYKFTNDELIVNNGKYGNFTMTKNESSVNVYNYFYSLIQSGNLKSFIQDQLFKKHHE